MIHLEPLILVGLCVDSLNQAAPRRGRAGVGGGLDDGHTPVLDLDGRTSQASYLRLIGPSDCLPWLVVEE